MKKKFIYFLFMFLLLTTSCENKNTQNQNMETKSQTELTEKQESSIENNDESNENSEVESSEVINSQEIIDNNYIEHREDPVNIVTNGVSSKGYKIETINGVTYVDGYLIANKTYSLPSTYVPENTHIPLNGMDWCAECIVEEAYQKYAEMRDKMQEEGMYVYIGSGYRGYYQQAGLYQMYVNSDGQLAADTYSARAGHSEHQTGYAFDICDYNYAGDCIEDSYEFVPSGKWINDNAYKYGYIIRYPKGKTNETGYIYEPWHLRYVGMDLAKILYNDGDWITMEDYFGITSAYND